jgi:L-glutamine:scyllo-inosose aminotransferase/L-glutamine:2-deoxy-scyllo-inosose/3-amino-2,3-dideoxy-scyllo-inosose aminotransferase
MLVHLYCTLADINQFLQLSASTGIPLIEDCSHAHGAAWRGCKVGTFGTIGVFSMQQTKVLTSGEGGATITSDPELYDRLQQLRADGRRYSAERFPGAPELEHVGDVQGHNYCLSELHAAILLDRLPLLEHENEIRRRNAALLTHRIQELDGLQPLHDTSSGFRPAFYRYCIRFDLSSIGGAPIENVATALSAELGISVSPIYDPLNQNRLLHPCRSPRNPGLEDLRGSYDPAHFALPVATAARREVIAIPHNALLGDVGEVEDIFNAIKKVLLCRDDLPNLS